MNDTKKTSIARWCCIFDYFWVIFRQEPVIGNNPESLLKSPNTPNKLDIISIRGENVIQSIHPIQYLV